MGIASAIARAKATGSAMNLRNALDDPFLIGAVSAFCGLLEATTSVVRVMPTSR
jgi:hypothetical protein